MLKHPIYTAYGLLLLGLLGFAEYRGFSFNSITEVKGVPKTVRDNPGSYRSHYRAVPRYFGGK
jgi:hypothetical protein